MPELKLPSFTTRTATSGGGLPDTFRIGIVITLLGCGSPQSPTESNGPCSAQHCDIVMQHLVTISDSSEPGMLGNLSSHTIQADSRGRYFTNSLWRDMVLLFDSTGDLVGRVGQRGRGPGEFQRIGSLVLGPADSVFVTDVELRRVTIIAPNLEVVRSNQAFYLPTLVGSDGSYIVVRQLPSLGASNPIHVTDNVGRTILRSFGADILQPDSESPLFTARVVAPSGDGTLWAMPVGRYVLERWNLETGQRTDRLQIASAWFRDTPRHTDIHDRPGTTVESLWEDEDGLLWILSRDADSEWTAPTVPRGAELPATSEHLNELYDWVLEVVDSRTGRVVASRRFAEYVRQRSPTPLIVTEKTSTDQVVRFDIWRPSLGAPEHPADPTQLGSATSDSDSS